MTKTFQPGQSVEIQAKPGAEWTAELYKERHVCRGWHWTEGYQCVPDQRIRASDRKESK